MESAFDLYAKVHTVGVDQMVKQINAGMVAIAGMITRLNNQQRGSAAHALADEVRSRYATMRYLEEQQIRSDARVAVHKRGLIDKALGLSSTERLESKERLLRQRDLALADSRRRSAEKESAELQEIGASANMLGPALAAAAIAAGTLAATIGDMFKRTVRWESSMIRTISLIGEGRFAVGSFYQAARDSMPLGINPQEIHQVLQVLAAAKTPSETLVRDAKNITKLSAVSGSAVQDLVKIYAEVNNKQQVYREDMLQFSRRNIPLADALRHSLGVTHDQLKTLISDGKIGFAEFSEALDKVANDSRYFGASISANARTTEGVLRRSGNAINVIWTGVSRAVMTSAASAIKWTGTAEVLEYYATLVLDRMEKADEHLANMLNKERELSTIAEEHGKMSAKYAEKLLEVERERIAADNKMDFLPNVYQEAYDVASALSMAKNDPTKNIAENYREIREARVEAEAQAAVQNRRERELAKEMEEKGRRILREAKARQALIDQLKLQGKTQEEIDKALEKHDEGAALRRKAEELRSHAFKVREEFSNLSRTDLGDPATQMAKKIHQVARVMRDEMGVTAKELRETFDIIWASEDLMGELKRFLPDVDFGNKEKTLKTFMDYATGVAQAVKEINSEIAELSGQDPKRQEIIAQGGDPAEYDRAKERLRVIKATSLEESKRRREELQAEREGLTLEQARLVKENEARGMPGRAQFVREVAAFNQLTDARAQANDAERQTADGLTAAQAKLYGIREDIWRIMAKALELNDMELLKRAKILDAEERQARAQQRRLALQGELNEMLDVQAHRTRRAEEAARDVAKSRLELRDKIEGRGAVGDDLRNKTQAIIEELKGNANPLQAFSDNSKFIKEMLLSGLDPGSSAGSGAGAAAHRSAQQAITDANRRHQFQTQVLDLMEGIQGALQGDVEATKEIGTAIKEIEAKAG